MSGTPTTAASAASRTRPSVAAVVVAHNAGEDVLPTLRALLPQVSRIYAVDNASSDETRAVLADFALAQPAVTLLHHAANNLASAQNLGIARAIADGNAFVLLMDDDSVPEPSMVGALLAARRTASEPDNIGICAPYLRDRNSNREPKYLRPLLGPFFRRSHFILETRFDDVLCVIASGSLIGAEVFAKAGMMDEGLAIDEVDRDFSLRVKKAGYRIVVTREAVLQHQLGMAKDHPLFGGTVTTSNHRAFRRYYIYRNRLKLWRRHGLAFPAFVTADLLAVAYDLARIALLESDRGAKLKAAWRGALDGFRGIEGMQAEFTPATEGAK